MSENKRWEKARGSPPLFPQPLGLWKGRVRHCRRGAYHIKWCFQRIREWLVLEATFKVHLVQPPAVSRDIFSSIRLLRAPSSLALNEAVCWHSASQWFERNWEASGRLSRWHWDVFSSHGYLFWKVWKVSLSSNIQHLRLDSFFRNFMHSKIYRSFGYETRGHLNLKQVTKNAVIFKQAT